MQSLGRISGSFSAMIAVCWNRKLKVRSANYFLVTYGPIISRCYQAPRSLRDKSTPSCPGGAELLQAVLSPQANRSGGANRKYRLVVKSWAKCIKSIHGLVLTRWFCFESRYRVSCFLSALLQFARDSDISKY